MLLVNRIVVLLALAALLGVASDLSRRVLAPGNAIPAAAALVFAVLAVVYASKTVGR